MVILSVAGLGYQILAVRNVRALIESGWCQNQMAVDADDVEVPYNSPRACKWCLLGAIYQVSATMGLNLMEFQRLFHRRTLHFDLAKYNDTHTHEEVLALLDNVIDVLEAEKWKS